jgi:hypothetical protein
MSIESSSADSKALRSFVVNCPEFRQLELLLGKFNIFEALKLSDHEIRHSTVLAWLLDPAENHGFGDLFLRRWLMRVLHDAESAGAESPDAVEIDAAQFQWVQVRREWNHIDLLIEIQLGQNQQWVVAVENKVWSTQHSDQLRRYRTVLESSYKNAQRCYVFLSVLPEEPEDDAYLSATYAQIADILASCLIERSGVIASGPLLVIEHYLQTIRSRFMPNSEVAALASKIYAAHSRALDILFEFRPDNLQLLTDELEACLVAASDSCAIRPMHTTKGFVRFIPAAWATLKNLPSERWSIFLCEINVVGGKVILRSFVEPKCPPVLRSRLFDLSRSEEFPNTVKRAKASELWYTFYAVKGAPLNLAELEPKEIPDLAKKIWSWCEGQIAEQSFTKMKASVTPLLDELPVPSKDAPEAPITGSLA